MTNLKKRERAKTNASLISMVQRFSDITIMFGGLWFICEVSGLPFLYMNLLVALITLVVFQMLGGMTDFYRSWRGVKISTELTLLLQNWTLSLIFSAGLVAFNDDFDNHLATWLAWYALSSLAWYYAVHLSVSARAGYAIVVITRAGSPSPEICLRARRCWIASVMSHGWVLRWWASITIPNRAASLLIGPGTSSS